MTHLFMYRLTKDTGLAPCVQDKLLSLSVCKGGQIRNGKEVNTGLRYYIGSQFHEEYKNDKVYVLGIYKNKLLYLAQVTEAMTMEEYFSKQSKGRMDNLYDLRNGKLQRNKHLSKEGIHIGEQSRRDIAGKYVLLSDNYTYLGQEAVEIDLLNQKGPKYQETKHYTGNEAITIINACKKVWDNKEHKPNDPFYEGCTKYRNKGCFSND